MSEAKVDTSKPATMMPEAIISAPKPKAFDKADPAKSERKQPNTCWGREDPSHRRWQCPKLSREDNLRLDRRKIRPVTTERSESPFLSATEQTSAQSSSEQKLVRSLADHEKSTGIVVRYRTKPIQAVVDIGSELTTDQCGSQPCEGASFENSPYRTPGSQIRGEWRKHAYPWYCYRNSDSRKEICSVRNLYYARYN